MINVKKPVEFRCFTQNLITFISLPGIVLVMPQMPCHCNHVIHSDKGRGVKKGCGKMGIADRGYAHGASGDGIHYLAIPSNLDSTELANFKSRARCHHETRPWMGRFKNFKILQDKFCHAWWRVQWDCFCSCGSHCSIPDGEWSSTLWSIDTLI